MTVRDSTTAHRAALRAASGRRCAAPEGEKIRGALRAPNLNKNESPLRGLVFERCAARLRGLDACTLLRHRFHESRSFLAGSVTLRDVWICIPCLTLFLFFNSTEIGVC